ncbi:MAG TPA: S-adenosylmethionine:tRNA ribosyltransferase-isomerase, partial [Polyangiaceae bacterium]|nr:S-adenosylmethionine:tRNA ribosyltransferase-isomerase [Polyangiaceae bacterium]
MRIDAFDYELPADRIAQYPTPEREQARLLVVPEERPDARGSPRPTFDPAAEFEDRTVADLADWIPEGALVVVNDTRVIPARVLGQKADTGGKVEVFLVRFKEERTIDIPGGEKRDVEVWLAMGKASKPLRFGSDVIAGNLLIHLLGRGEDGLLEVGVSITAHTAISVRSALQTEGHVPLPPYIKREDEALDRERYQTVFARVPGALAAPTAGLHLSRALLGRLAVRGCELASVTLHVGLGTFQPVTVDDLDAHRMHAETFEISRTTASAIDRARERGAPVVAIGTTVVRALESAAHPERPGHVVSTQGET